MLMTSFLITKTVVIVLILIYYDPLSIDMDGPGTRYSDLLQCLSAVLSPLCVCKMYGCESVIQKNKLHQHNVLHSANASDNHWLHPV